MKMPRLPLRLGGVLLAALLVIHCGHAVTTVPDKETIAPESGTGFLPRAGATGSRSMVVAPTPQAAQAGRWVLSQGGTAADAAIAMALNLTLTEPHASGIGGGAFLLHHDPQTQAVNAYDGRETAPAAARPTQFQDENGKPLRFFDAVVGGLSVGTPGAIRLYELVHKKHGGLPWATLFQPTIELAKRGFPMSARLHAHIAKDPWLSQDPTARGYFYQTDGTPKAVGTLLKNPALAHTLQVIAQQGATAFYTGEIAARIVQTVQKAHRRPGHLAVDDLAGYQAKERPVLCRPYRQWRICGMPPPTSGGIATLQILGHLLRFPSDTVGADTPESAHLFAESSRLAYADRGRYVADSDFVDTPVTALLEPAYLKSRSQLIQEDRSMGVAMPGDPQPGRAEKADDESLELPSTSHLAVVDSQGRAVTMTASIEYSFGSHLMVGGFLLNNELTDFSFRTQRNGRPIANRLEPRKRPRSSMSPTLVFDRDSGDLHLAIGSPGGSRIIGYVARALIRILDGGLTIQEALMRPNIINRNGKTEVESVPGWEDWAHKTVQILKALGHDASIQELNSGLHGIQRTDTGWLGSADPRRDGLALGE